jgi:hypothetical protein
VNKKNLDKSAGGGSAYLSKINYFLLLQLSGFFGGESGACTTSILFFFVVVILQYMESSNGSLAHGCNARKRPIIFGNPSLYSAMRRKT